MLKRCSSCKEVKDGSLFVVDNSSFDRLARVCKSCKNLFYLSNKKRIALRRKEVRNANKESENTKKRDYYRTKDGHISLMLSSIKQRCENPNAKRYHRYGGRGIKNLISREDINFLWDRDNASSLKNPSIDRIDNDGNYILDNCQIIEKRLNSSKDMKKRQVSQIDINDNIIKVWDSLADAERCGFQRQNIYHCCQGKRPYHKGFKWKYV